MASHAKRFVFGVMVIHVAAMWAGKAAACSCMAIEDIAKSARETDIVFTGSVVERSGPIRRADSDLVAFLKRIVGMLGRHGPDEYAYDFNVTEPLKGALRGTFRVHSATDSAACGYDFKIGTKYLVFARVAEGRNIVSLCSATSKLSEHSETEMLRVREALLGHPTAHYNGRER